MAVFVSTVDGEVVEGTDDIDSMTAVHNNVALIGLAGGDEFTGDELFSVVGVDGTIMEGGAGIDFLTGLGTNDTASYALSPAGVTVDLFVEDFGFGIAYEDGYVDSDPSAPDDLLNMIENVTGSDHDDSLTGDVNANVLQGGEGNDTLAGDGGADFFKFSFDVEHVSGSGDTPQSFGEWLSTEHALNIANLNQNEFVQNYKEWLGYIADELRENHGFDSIPENAKVSFKQNDSGGMPQIEGLTQTLLGEIFGDASAISVKTGKTSQGRYYSDIDPNSDVWGGSEEDVIMSTDGLDTILDFTSGVDKLDFSDITQQQFDDHFTVTVGAADTVITMDGPSEWQLTLSGVTTQLAANDFIFAA